MGCIALHDAAALFLNLPGGAGSVGGASGGRFFVGCPDFSLDVAGWGF